MVQLLIDFGLVILIWMTQLVVYPSFEYFGEERLMQWHERYTTAISIIVMPLMLGQVTMHGYALYADFSYLRLINIFLVGLTWVNTFLVAVPLHGKISAGEEVIASAKKLVRINWYRTVIWTLVFILNLFLENRGLWY